MIKVEVESFQFIVCAVLSKSKRTTMHLQRLRYKMPRYSLDIALNSMFSKHTYVLSFSLFLLYFILLFFFLRTQLVCLYPNNTAQHKCVPYFLVCLQVLCVLRKFACVRSYIVCCVCAIVSVERRKNSFRLWKIKLQWQVCSMHTHTHRRARLK